MATSVAPEGGTVSHAPAVGRVVGAASLLGPLGVVYGDIGTSPLYALRETLGGTHGTIVAHDEVLGVLSLFTWSLVLVVTIKYLAFVLRADNRGEGGVLALLALIVQGKSPTNRRDRIIIWLGLTAAMLLFGDGIITPAISVLSAVEGLEATGISSAVVVPATCTILVALFLIQRRGTAQVAAWFGPVMLVWFATLVAIGVPAIVRRPEVLLAVNPLNAVAFFRQHGWSGALILSSVVLCVTGAEALYADLGHFGRTSIRRVWLGLVFPALLVNYFGQGALLLDNPTAVRNPFYGLVSGWLIYPLIGIATAATIIASQALISGAFSLTQQAIQLGYLPRAVVVHTSAHHRGQIFVPATNGFLMIGCLWLVLEFRSSSGLAGAYGIAVTGTMLLTTILFFVLLRWRWHWNLLAALSLGLVFVTVDIAFLGANLGKVADGGWVPLLVAALGLEVSATWIRGRDLLRRRVVATTFPLDAFILDVELTHPPRVAGTAVFMTSGMRGVPTALLHHFKHNKVLHERVFILSVVTDDIPTVAPKNRVRWKAFPQGFVAVTAHFGFMQTPNVQLVFDALGKEGLHISILETSFYLGRETLVRAPASDHDRMSLWRFNLFRFLSRNAGSPADFFGLPSNRVVEVGTQHQL